MESRREGEARCEDWRGSCKSLEGPFLHTGNSGLAKGKRWRIVSKVLKVWSQARSSGCR